MIFLFILKQLCVLETKGSALYRRALQLLEVSLCLITLIDGCHSTLDCCRNFILIALHFCEKLKCLHEVYCAVVNWLWEAALVAPCNVQLVFINKIILMLYIIINSTIVIAIVFILFKCFCSLSSTFLHVFVQCQFLKIFSSFDCYLV